MKKLLVVTVLLLTVVGLTFADASTTANVTANVNATVTITRTADLALGNVNQGATKAIASNVAGAAAFTIGGAASAATTVTVTVPTDLTNGSNTLPFTAVLPTYSTTGVQGTSTAFAATTGGTANTSATGTLSIWVGGSVTAGATQAAGSYTGTITVSVTQP
jgi:Mat/Ecp fimbriae major subunit